jgi:surface antigen
MPVAYRLVLSSGEVRRVACRLACVAALAPALGACSFAIPSLTTSSAPEETTGSITPAPAAQRLFPELGPEETRRSRAALAVALEPQGNGKAVKWDNPESGMHGDIVPEGVPYVEADEICRAFTASLRTAAGVTKTAEGRACKISADEWVLRKLQPRRQS